MKNLQKNKKRYIFFIIIFIALIVILVPNYIIESDTEGKTFFNTSLIKKNKVGLVLGTSKYLTDGGINLYFKYRIDAAVELFTAKKN